MAVPAGVALQSEMQEKLTACALESKKKRSTNKAKYLEQLSGFD